jgi:hypothetical protein
MDDGSRRAHDHLVSNLVWYGLALALAVVLQGYYIRDAYDTVETYVATTCRVTNARAQLVQNFWSDAAAADDVRAASADSAQANWKAIHDDLVARHLDDPAIRTRIGNVAPYWKAIGDSDRAEAARMRAYILAIQGDYNKVCGETSPTPQAMRDRTP